MDVASLRVLFTADGDGTVTRAIDNVNNKLGTVDGHARRAGGALTSMFKVAGGFLLAQGITNAVGGILQMNSNAEQAKVALEVALGSAEKAEATFQRVQKMAAATPFSTQELLNSTLQLESLGLSSEKWLTTIGDTAAGTTKSVNQVTQAVLDASFGEYERLKEFGIQSRVEGDKVTFSYIKNGKQINETVDKNNKAIIQSTLQAIWNDKYAGAMAKQSKTFAGQWSTLKDNAAIAMMNMTEGLFSGLTGILDFVNNVFADGLESALRSLGGFGETLANAVGWVEAFGNAFKAAFGSGIGIDKLVEFLPERFAALEQPILAIADALGDLKAAWDTGGFEGFKEAFSEEALNILGGFVDIGVIAVRFAWGELINVGESLWQKVVDYSGLGNVSDATGGPNAPVLPFTTVDVIVAGIIKLGGDLDDLGARIAEELGLARTDADMAAAREEGRLLGQDIWDEFTGGMASGFGGDGGGKAEDIQAIAQQIFELVNPIGQLKKIYESDTIFAEWMNVGIGISQGIFNAIREGFTGTTTTNMMTGTSVTQGGLAGWLNDMGEDFFGFSDIPTPDLPDWMTDFGWITGPIDTLISTIDGMIGLVRAALARLRDAVTGGGGGAPDPTGGGMGLNLIPSGVLEGLMARTDEFSTPATPVEVPITVKPTVESVDWSVIKESLNPFGGGFGTGGDSPFSGMAFTAKLDADSAPFEAVKRTVDASLDTFAATTSTATFDIDNGPAAVKYTEAFGWGETFAAQTWVATFDIDNGPAAVAYTEAFGWGSTWAAQTFTASFSIDTSGLDAAASKAFATAQYIRDIMPNSPAKIGPLSGKVPSLDYIADSFQASFARMRSEADWGMAGVAAGTSGRSGSVGGLHVGTAYVYPATGDLQREITASAIGEWR